MDDAAKKELFEHLGKWNGKNVSGQGFLGSPKLSRNEIKYWEKYLLQNFGTKFVFLEKEPTLLKANNLLGNQAGFQAATNTIYVRKGVTNFEIIHEM